MQNFCGDKTHQGGGVAAPIASQVLGEVLPYLEIKKDNVVEDDAVNKVVVPNIEGLSCADAKKILKELNLSISINDTVENEDYIIQEQIPISGVEVFEQSTIIAK